MKRFLYLSALGLWISAPLPLAIAAPTGTTQARADTSHAQAMALLDKSAAAYAALKGLSMRTSYYAEVPGEILRGTTSFAYEKSGRYRVTLSVSPEPQIMAVAAKDAEAAKKSISRAAQYGAPGAALPLSSLVQGLNPLREVSVTLMGERYLWDKKARLLPHNGVALTMSSLDDPEALLTEVALYFDPNDHLLRRVDLKAQDEEGKLFGSSLLLDVQINPHFAADTFVVPQREPYALQGADVEPKRITWDPKIQVGGEPYALKGANLAKYKGKVVLLDFWATWCGPCVKEVPGILSSYRKHHGEGFEIIGISRDTNKKALAEFVKARKLPWTQVFDRDYGKLSNTARYGVKAIPFTLLIGRDGKIAAVNPRGSELEPALKKALAQ